VFRREFLEFIEIFPDDALDSEALPSDFFSDEIIAAGNSANFRLDEFDYDPVAGAKTYSRYVASRSTSSRSRSRPSPNRAPPPCSRSASPPSPESAAADPRLTRGLVVGYNGDSSFGEKVRIGRRNQAPSGPSGSRWESGASPSL
jgi:hypothetical protein